MRPFAEETGIKPVLLAVPLEELPFKHDTLAYGVYELPVTW